MAPSDDIEQAEEHQPNKPKAYAVVTMTGDVPTSTTEKTNGSFSLSGQEALYPSQQQNVLVEVDPNMLDLACSMNESINGSIAGDDLPFDPEVRKAKLCFGCCCDLLRACVIVDIVDIVLSLVMVGLSMSFGLGTETFLDAFFIDFSGFAQMDDDETMLTMIPERREAIIQTVSVGLGVLFSIIGIFGALKYQRYLVLVTGIWFCLDTIRACYQLSWPSAILTPLFAYPHFALFFALRRGEITRNTYDSTEKHCCCGCVEPDGFYDYGDNY